VQQAAPIGAREVFAGTLNPLALFCGHPTGAGFESAGRKEAQKLREQNQFRSSGYSRSAGVQRSSLGFFAFFRPPALAQARGRTMRGKTMRPARSLARAGDGFHCSAPAWFCPNLRQTFRQNDGGQNDATGKPKALWCHKIMETRSSRVFRLPLSPLFGYLPWRKPVAEKRRKKAGKEPQRLRWSKRWVKKMHQARRPGIFLPPFF
jgi:hypothetical protein